jgi:choline monooxygenase
LRLGDVHVGQGSLLYKRGAIEGRSLPTFPDLETHHKATVAEYITVFPNLMLGVHPDYFLVFTVNPLSPNETHERMAFYFVGDEAMTPENEGPAPPAHRPLARHQRRRYRHDRAHARWVVNLLRFDGGCFSPELEQNRLSVSANGGPGSWRVNRPLRPDSLDGGITARAKAIGSPRFP